MFQYVWQIILCASVSYFICNFNYAVLISKNLMNQDIRKLGSHNPGTTNMFRVFGARLGLLTFVLDATKGVVTSFGGYYIFLAMTHDVNLALQAGYICGFAGVIGHIYPIIYKFNGGKGVATSLAVFICLNTIPTLIIVGIGIVLLLITDRMSIFALFVQLAELIYHLIVFIPLNNYIIIIFESLVFLLVVIAHRQNIVRLFKRCENAMGLHKLIFKKK